MFIFLIILWRKGLLLSLTFDSACMPLNFQNFRDESVNCHSILFLGRVAPMDFLIFTLFVLHSVLFIKIFPSALFLKFKVLFISVGSDFFQTKHSYSSVFAQEFHREVDQIYNLCYSLVFSIYKLMRFFYLLSYRSSNLLIAQELHQNSIEMLIRFYL